MRLKKSKNRRRIRKLVVSLFLCVVMLSGIFGSGFGTYAANAETTTDTMPDSLYYDSSFAGNILKINRKTFSSYKFTGVSGARVLNGKDLNSNDVMALCVPVRDKAFSYTDFLDIYFENVGTVGNRRINAQVHFNRMSVEAPYASVPANSGLICVAYLGNSVFEVSSKTNGKNIPYFGQELAWKAASTYEITVTLTWADTGKVADIPMLLCLSDIDAGSAGTYTEGWEGISGFTGALYKYKSNQNDISGLKVMAGSDYTDVSGDDSWLKKGIYAQTVNGTFRSGFYEGDCATALQVYCSYTEMPSVDKEASDPDKIYAVGDTVQWFISQNVLKFYTETFDKYTSMAFYDYLPDSLDYVEGTAKLYHNGTDVTNSYGTLNYDRSKRTLTYTLKASVLEKISFYDGGSLKLVLDTVVNENAVTDQSTDGRIKNTAVVNVSGVEYEATAAVDIAGTGYVKKADAQTNEAVAGAVYYVYTDKTCSTRAKDIYGKPSYFTTTAEPPYSNGISYKPGIYYVKEYSVPSDYLLDDTVYTLVITGRKASYVDAGWVYDAPFGTLNVRKSSGIRSLTEDNNCYSLEGAEYGVYASKADAQNDTNRVAELTTGADGETESVDLICGKYYVKEVTASRGYMLCDGAFDGASDGIHAVTLKQGETSTVECTEPPANNPFALQLQKLDYDTGEAAAQGIASLEGGIFAVEYYTNTDGVVSGSPFRTWYFQTDKEGHFCSSSDDSFVLSHTMNDGSILNSDDLYRDLNGTVVYPIGTYRIREVSPPMYYQNNGYMHFKEDSICQSDVNTGLKAVIRQDENGGIAHIYDGDNVRKGHMDDADLAVNVYDKIKRGSVTVCKQEADGSETPLEGVTFQLVGLEEGGEYTAATDGNGKIVWDNLIPQNYVITEIKTVDGYSLLKDNIEVRLPLEMTLDEIHESGADINKAVFDEVSQKYCFYDLTYTVGNSVTFDMPFTGSSQNMIYIIPAAFGMVILGIIQILRKRMQ